MIAGGLIAFLAGGIVVERANLFPWLTFAIQRTPAALPSTAMVPADDVAAGWPIISIYLDPRDLEDPGSGLLTHPLERGADWERRAFVSYFDGGRLMFASEAGVRIHGGKSRQFSPVRSFRLYFRRQYGAEQFAPGVLFDGASDPLERLVLHNDLRQDADGGWWHFGNPLAFDIARRIGSLAPRVQPALMFLNGNRLGPYVLMEHVNDKDFLEARFGHRNFTYADGADTRRALRALAEIQPLTMAAANEYVDLENFTRWYIAMVYCATTNPYQGPFVRDDTRPGAPWFVVTWDMDHSFMDLYKRTSNGRAWRHDTFRWTRTSRDLRPSVVLRLLNEDAEYREYFKQLFTEILNHRVTPAFLKERFAYYADAARALGTRSTDYLPALEAFLANRHAALMRLSRPYVSSPGVYAVSVRSSRGSVVVDGHAVTGDYRGWYFDGMPIRIEVISRPDQRFRYWTRNGRPVLPSSPTLELPVTERMRLHAVFAPANER